MWEVVFELRRRYDGERFHIKFVVPARTRDDAVKRIEEYYDFAGVQVLSHVANQRFDPVFIPDECPLPQRGR